jgi:peptidoglycan/xylan/chitin deacetylase (PgdA/CDA1 family)
MASASLRWYVKKSARLGVALGSGLSGSMIVRRFLGSPAVRVLTYHKVGEATRDPFCVARSDFDEQMAALAESGRAVCLDQLQGFLAGRESLPAAACLVTIDDGLESTMTEAWPVLQRYKVPAIAFVSTSLVGRTLDGVTERYLGWSELREMAASGLLEVGSHAHTHRSLGLMPLSEAVEEAKRSRQLLQDELGREARSFAYPFGTQTDFNDETDRALEAAGYSVAFNSMHGSIRTGMNPISLPRVKVEGGDPTFVFSWLTHGGMDAWRAVDQTLWRFQRQRRELV